MLKNYFKVAIRYLFRNKAYSFINLFGLSVGITFCILIMLFVKSEWSFDRFHKNSNRLYRAWLFENYEGQTFTNTLTPIPLGPVLKQNIPEIEADCRVYAFNTLVKYNGNKFNENITMVDSNFFQIFDFNLSEGPSEKSFSNSNSLVITEELARKYFGREEAIGKNLELQLGNDMKLFTVTAVAKTAPHESSIQFDILIPHSNEKLLFSERAITSGWTNVFLETYFLLKKGVAGKQVEDKIPAVGKLIAGDNYKPGEYNVYLQPMTAIHLDKKLPAGNQPVSDPKYSYILATIGILILFIACINFVTLSVGRSVTRSLEVGVRKVMGADRPQLIRQFWGEALLMVAVSFIIAVALSLIFIKPFNGITNKQLVLSFDAFTILFFLSVLVLVGLLAGIYPALVLSSFRPVQVLKGKLPGITRIGIFRKGLITSQFVASIVMIIATIVTGQQLNYLRNKNLGYDREHIIIVSTNKPRIEGLPLAERYKTELAKDPQVVGSSASIFSFAEPGWFNLGYEDDKKVYRNFRMNAVDPDFLKTMHLHIINGRDFSADNPADLNNSIIVNEALVKEYGWDDPIGKKLPGRYEHQVIGVVKDFNFESLHNKIQPLALVQKLDSIVRKSSDIAMNFAPQPRVSIRLKAGNLSAQVESLKSAWKKVAADQDFQYQFLDESLDKLYRAEQRTGKFVRYASVFSIFIACLGLFGLSTLVVTRRTREIGIRKVLGADVKGLVTLLSKEFIWLIVIATLIAFPVSWWALNKWLEDFAYRISISWWVFILAGLITLIITLTTVSIQSIKAAVVNPVNSLRTE